MTGYEKSPDYGGPEKVNWWLVAFAGLVVAGLVALIVLAALRQAPAA